MKTIRPALSRLKESNSLQNLCVGNIALLCHNASITEDYQTAPEIFQMLFKKRFIKLFGPQHGFVSDVQDNMIETYDYIHPYFGIPVHSLYGETRIPTDNMLKDINTFVIDLQDVGTRVYTYISTLGLLLEKLNKTGIRVIILDRHNPVGGELIEGNVLEKEFHSFVGHHKIPMRHAMTMGEIALFTQKYHSLDDLDLHVIKCENWNRNTVYHSLLFPWTNPSPNLSTPNGAYVFCGSVLFEGCHISEGRGTTRALEQIGFPKIEAYSFCKQLENEIDEEIRNGLACRPIHFHPMFQKHAHTGCGGVFIEVKDPRCAKTWEFGQHLMKNFYKHLKEEFIWNEKPYEYEHDRLAIDLINGSSKIRNWIENNGTKKELRTIVDKSGLSEFIEKRSACLLYS
ncbi:MAG: DUF1343 domain-containing protein [Halobacteriovoraceae bacterium]|nr:DUF1343 domain-containing protein [Halobacteriovoraceae bacterium]